MENKIDFLKTSISDTQELIRFTDSKTAIVITILGAYVVAFFTSIEKIIKYSYDYSLWFWLFLILFVALLVICVLVTTRIIKPTNNPLKNIKLGSEQLPSLKFYLALNEYSKNEIFYLKNSDEFKLSESFETYIGQIKTTTDEDIIKSLTLELFKVSYIRNIKNDRFNILLKLLLLTTITFAIAYFFYSKETQNIIEQIDFLRSHCCHR